MAKTGDELANDERNKLGKTAKEQTLSPNSKYAKPIVCARAKSVNPLFENP